MINQFYMSYKWHPNWLEPNKTSALVMTENIDWALKVTTSTYENGPRCNGNERVLHNPPNTGLELPHNMQLNVINRTLFI